VGFVGVRTVDPEAVARRVQSELLAATQLHCSMGIGDNEVRAKIWHGRAGRHRAADALAATRIDVALSDRLPRPAARPGRHRRRERSPRGGAHPGAQPVRARQTGPVRGRGHAARRFPAVARRFTYPEAHP